MHEYSIVQALLDRVSAEARARQASAVHKIHVQIGEMSGVETALLATAYAFFREKTVCEKAEIEIEAVPVRWECRACTRPIAGGGPLRCGACGGEVRLVSGDEIVLSRIEMEVA